MKFALHVFITYRKTKNMLLNYQEGSLTWRLRAAGASGKDGSEFRLHSAAYLLSLSLSLIYNMGLSGECM